MLSWRLLLIICSVVFLLHLIDPLLLLSIEYEIIKVAVNDRTLGSVEDKNKVRADILKGMVNIILSE